MGRLIQALVFVKNKSRIAIKTGRIILLLSPDEHLMFYAPPLEGKAWRLNPPKSLAMLNPQFKGTQPIDVFIVPRGRWSDRSAAPVMQNHFHLAAVQSSVSLRATGSRNQRAMRGVPP
jgi:hypothetical protein